MKPRATEFYTYLILSWHRSLGVRGNLDAVYRSSVDSMAQKDLRSREVQISIANLQISGSWEWAYSHVLPAELWVEACKTYELNPLVPKNLGETARKIIETVTGEAEEPFVVRFSNAEDLLAKASSFYEKLAKDETLGRGAVAFLLSCSIERGLCEPGQITLLPLTVLGIEEAPSGRPGDFLELVRSGKVAVREVIGNTTENSRIRRRDVESHEESDDV